MIAAGVLVRDALCYRTTAVKVRRARFSATAPLSLPREGTFFAGWTRTVDQRLRMVSHAIPPFGVHEGIRELLNPRGGMSRLIYIAPSWHYPSCRDPHGHPGQNSIPVRSPAASGCNRRCTRKIPPKLAARPCRRVYRQKDPCGVLGPAPVKGSRPVGNGKGAAPGLRIIGARPRRDPHRQIPCSGQACGLATMDSRIAERHWATTAVVVDEPRSRTGSIRDRLGSGAVGPPRLHRWVLGGSSLLSTRPDLVVRPAWWHPHHLGGNPLAQP